MFEVDSLFVYSSMLQHCKQALYNAYYNLLVFCFVILMLILPAGVSHVILLIVIRVLAGKDPSPRCFQDNTCELFGHTYVTGVAVLDATSHLFSLAR